MNKSKTIVNGAVERLNSNNKKPLIAASIIIIFASTGAYFLLSSQAATVLRADFNNDKVVSILDLSILASNYGRTGATKLTGDADGNGTVNITDMSILSSEWGQTITPTPTPTPTPTSTTSPTPTPTPLPSGSISVLSYGAKPNDGIDDTAAILSAANAGASANKQVYIPTGKYNTGTLTLPAGVAIYGDGSSKTHLTGLLRFKSNNTIKNMKLGDPASTWTVGPGSYSTTNVKFDGVRFRGGDPTKSNYPPVFTIPTGHSVDGLYIDNCEFERNLGYWDPNGSAGAYDQTVDTSQGDIQKNIWITNSHFGVSNGVAMGQPTYNIVLWQSEETGSGYWEDIHINNNIFEATDEFNLDFDGLWAYNYGHNTVEIKNNLIKGGGKMRGTTKPSWGYTICVEPTRSGTIIEGNTLYRGYYNVFKTTKDTTDTIFRNNIIDLRVDNGVVFYYSDYYRTINLYSGARNTVTGNTIYLPPTPTRSSQVIFNNEVNSIINGNSIIQ